MAEAVATLPHRPPSEVEWEDLLLRLELMTRAFRNAIEDVELVAALPLLRGMVTREESVGAWLERHAVRGRGAAGTKHAANPEVQTIWTDPALLADRLVSLRARNFAMVQRRGLEVWSWSGTFSDAGDVSAFQLLTWLMRHDVKSLATLRAIARGEESPRC